MRKERHDRRDIAAYIADPHVVLAIAPQELFLDPSHTYRLDLDTYDPPPISYSGFTVRRLHTRRDAEQINAIYAARNMVPVPPEFFCSLRESEAITVLVAEDELTGAVLGSITGVDHAGVFNDPERGSSF